MYDENIVGSFLKIKECKFIYYCYKGVHQHCLPELFFHVYTATIELPLIRQNTQQGCIHDAGKRMSPSSKADRCS